MEKVINGYWDGLPIWRYKTALELLIEALDEEAKAAKDKALVSELLSV